MDQIEKDAINYSNQTNTKNQIDQVELEYALDYQLQDSTNELYAALKAHSCYWKSADVALFIMQQLCNKETV